MAAIIRRLLLVSVVFCVLIGGCTTYKSGTESSGIDTFLDISPTASPTLEYPLKFGTPFPTPQTTPIGVETTGFKEIVRWGNGKIVSSTWSADGSKIFVSSSTGIFVYSYPELTRIAYQTHAPVSYPVFSMDGTHIAFAGQNIVEYWDIETPQLVNKLEVPNICLGLIFDPATGYLNGLFRETDGAPLRKIIWDADTNQVIEETTFAGIKGSIILVSKDQSIAVNRISPYIYGIWDLQKNEEIYRQKFSMEDRKKSVYFISNDGEAIFFVDYYTVYLFDTSKMALSSIIADTDGFSSVILELGNGAYLIEPDFSPYVAIYDIHRQEQTPTGLVLDTPLSIDITNQRILDHKGNIYQITPDQTLSPVGRLEDFQRDCCEVSAQGKYLAGWNDKNLQLFSAEDGKLLAETETDVKDNENLLVFTPSEDKLVMLNSSAAAIEVYSVPDLTLLGSISLAPITIDKRISFYSMPISNDGRYLSLSAFTENYLLMVDLTEMRVLYKLDGKFYSSAFHPSGVLAVEKIFEDQTYKIDPATGNTIEKIQGYQIAGVTPDGSSLIVFAEGKKMVQNWETGIVGSMTKEIEESLYGAIDELAASSGLEERYLQAGIYIPQQHRYYLKLDGDFRIFEEQ